MIHNYRPTQNSAGRPVLYHEDGSETELPWQYEICDSCQGHGKSSAYLGAFTADDMQEDPEFSEAYMAGDYDRACEACNGSGKAIVPDFERMTDEQQAAWLQQESDAASDAQSEYMEWLFTGGWQEMGWGY